MLGYSVMTRPLTALLRQNAEFVWTPECQTAFQAVKDALTNAPVLGMPDFSKPFEVVADACVHGIGALLMQEGRPVAFESRKLIPAEVNYSTTEQELLAVVHALGTWRCYLEGVEFTVITDHCPLTFFATQPNLSRRQARWMELLQRYKFRWQYRPGRLNVANPLSRTPVGSVAVMLLGATTRAKQAQRNTTASDPALADLFSRCKAGYSHDSWFADGNNTAELSARDGLWWHDDALVIPNYDGLRRECLESVHDTPYSGHPGVAKTTKLAERVYWWPGMRNSVLQFVRTCDKCQHNKSSNQKPAGLLKPVQIPGRRWESVSMDLITALPKTARGKDALVVFVNRLTKMVHLQAITTNITAAQLAHSFIDNVFVHHGVPKELISDRDPRFTSNFWKEVCRTLGVRQSMSTAYHPQTDGQTERANRTLEEMLRHNINPSQDNWDLLLGTAEFAINNSWHESVQNTPFMLNYGQHPLTPASLAIDSKVPAAREFTEAWQNNLARAKQMLQAAQSRQKAYADRHRRELSFEEGDKVLLSTKNLGLKTTGTPKLLPRWVGPFSVTERIGELAYRVELPPSLKVHNVFHVSVLKAYRSDGRVQPPPLPIDVDEDGELFAVEQVLQHRDRKIGRRRSVRKFLINWEHFGEEHNSWEAEANLNEAALRSYWEKRGQV